MKLLTPPGVAGVAVVSARGDERGALLACLRTPSGAAFTPGAAPRRAVLLLDGEVVDDVLVLARGEALELHTHGSPAVLDQLDRRFGLQIEPPRSPAERLLREALSVAQFELAAEQLGFDFDAELQALRDLPQPARAAGLAAALARSRHAMAMVEPQRVVLVGRQNAGKSSLFNRLLFRERALTGATPGLTRDPVVERTVLAGYPYELVDTAGEGEVACELDRVAIDAGRAARGGALLLLVVDGSAAPTAVDRELAREAALIVTTRGDLPTPRWPDDLPPAEPVCAVRGDAAGIRDRIGARLRSLRGLPVAGPVGGFAALDAWQRRTLRADGADEDCQRAAPPA